MIPERGGLLIVEPVVRVRLTRQERVVGRAVGSGGHVVAVHVHGGARRRGVVPSVVGPVQRRVDPERVRPELVARDVGHGLTALRDHDRPEVGDRGIRRVGEGWRLAEIAVEAVRSRSHRQPARGQLRRRDDRRDRQWIDERSHRSRRDRLRFILGRGHRAGPSVRNQQRATRGDTARQELTSCQHRDPLPRLSFYGDVVCHPNATGTCRRSVRVGPYGLTRGLSTGGRERIICRVVENRGSIVEALAGKRILLTGVTGFLGQVSSNGSCWTSPTPARPCWSAPSRPHGGRARPLPDSASRPSTPA